MCKVGGPRCNGSHTPTAGQRARRKANRAYRSALADTIAEQTGNQDLARHVANARMTDLYEVALLAGINPDEVARRAGSATYTSPDGETVTVEARPTGASRRTRADNESMMLFDAVRAAYQVGEPSEWEIAALDGDRDELNKLEDEAQKTWAELEKKIPDNIEDMDFEELKKLHGQMYNASEDVRGLSPHTNPEVEKAMSDMYAEIDRRAMNKISADPTALPNADMLDKHVVDEVYAARDMRESLGEIEEADTADLIATLRATSTARSRVYAETAAPETRAYINQMGADVTAELQRRAHDEDDLTAFPAYTWPGDTTGKTLPTNAQLADNAEFYYGLTPVAESEYTGIYGTGALDDDDVEFKGMSPAGQAVYRSGSTLAFVEVPGDDTAAHSRSLYTKYWAEQAEDFNDAGVIELGDTSTAKYFGMASDELTSAINSTDPNDYSDDPLQMVNRSRTNPCYGDISDTSDERISVLSCAASGYEEIVDHYRDIPLATGRSHNTDEAYLDALRCVAESRSRDARRELGRTLDARAAAEGDNHAMSYSQALDVVYADAYNRAPDTKKAADTTAAVVTEFEQAATHNREPDWKAINTTLKNYQDDKAKHIRKAERLLSGAEMKYGGDYRYNNHDNRISWRAGGPTGDNLADIVDTKNTATPLADSGALTSQDDATIAAAYIRAHGTRQVDARIEAIHPHIKDDGTYTSVRVTQVSDTSRAEFLDHVAENTLDSWGKDASARGVVRNRADNDSMEDAARNYRVIYATAMDNLYGIDDIDERNPNADDLAYIEMQQAYRHRLNELYDAANAGDAAAKIELVNTAVAAYADDADSLITRQYVNPDQGSLF